MSYNEELFLWTVYIILFIILLNLMSLFVKNYIIKESFNLISFYENFFYLKNNLLIKIINFIKIIFIKEILKFLLFKEYLLLLKNDNINNNLKKKEELEIFFLLNYYLENIYLKK